MSELKSTNIADLTTQIKDLIDARKTLITQLKSLNKRRLDMRDEIGDVTSTLATEQAKLEPLYNEANKHKHNRSKLIVDLRKIRSSIRTTNDNLKLIEPVKNKNPSTIRSDRKFPRREKKENTKTLSKKLQDTEWKLQTQKLSRQEEKNLIDIIKGIEIKLKQWKKSTSTRKELSTLFKQVKQKSSELDDLSESRSSMNSSIDEKKILFTEQMNTREKLFNEMIGYSNDIAQLEHRLKNTDSKLRSLKQKRNELFKSIKSGNKSKILKKKKVILEKEKSKAKEKLESGQSLSFEELRLAFDDTDEYLK